LLSHGGHDLAVIGGKAKIIGRRVKIFEKRGGGIITATPMDESTKKISEKERGISSSM